MRAAIRAGEWDGPTAAFAPGYAQANLVALPERDAFDFLRFCVANPKPCPEITSRFTTAHGAPGHIGDPLTLEIPELATPDSTAIRSRSATARCRVICACGVTPQAVAAASRPELMITHAPGHMFVTGVPDER